MSIFSAAGTFGRPGIVIMSPVSATMKPAPAETLRLRTVIVNPSGAPRLAASSENDYCVFAMQIGRSPTPSSVRRCACFFAPEVSCTPSA